MPVGGAPLSVDLGAPTCAGRSRPRSRQLCRRRRARIPARRRLPRRSPGCRRRRARSAPLRSAPRARGHGRRLVTATAEPTRRAPSASARRQEHAVLRPARSRGSSGHKFSVTARRTGRSIPGEARVVSLERGMSMPPTTARNKPQPHHLFRCGRPSGDDRGRLRRAPRAASRSSGGRATARRRSRRSRRASPGVAIVDLRMPRLVGIELGPAVARTSAGDRGHPLHGATASARCSPRRWTPARAASSQGGAARRPRPRRRRSRRRHLRRPGARRRARRLEATAKLRS